MSHLAEYPSQPSADMAYLADEPPRDHVGMG